MPLMSHPESRLFAEPLFQAKPKALQARIQKLGGCLPTMPMIAQAALSEIMDPPCADLLPVSNLHKYRQRHIVLMDRT